MRSRAWRPARSQTAAQRRSAPRRCRWRPPLRRGPRLRSSSSSSASVTSASFCEACRSSAQTGRESRRHQLWSFIRTSRRPNARASSAASRQSGGSRAA
eukprot:5586941-Prymnesium_polylepis.1